jgi:hypothetical protein
MRHVWGEKRKVLVCEPGGKRSLARTRHRWEGSETWRTVVNTINNLRVAQNAGSFLTNWECPHSMELVVLCQRFSYMVEIFSLSVVCLDAVFKMNAIEMLVITCTVSLLVILQCIPTCIQLWRRWHSWLRHCATSRMVAGSISGGITGIFHWLSPSGLHMSLV